MYTFQPRAAAHCRHSHRGLEGARGPYCSSSLPYSPTQPNHNICPNVHTPSLPPLLPPAGMGVVTKIGAGVSGFKEGQRVTALGWMGPEGNGSWQQYINVPVDRVVALPDCISDEAGAQFYVCATGGAYGSYLPGLGAGAACVTGVWSKPGCNRMHGKWQGMRLEYGTATPS